VRLDALIAATREALARRRAELPLRQLERLVELDRGGRPFAEALARPGTSVIAEYKRRSPSAGTIRDDLDVADVVSAYERGGAAAISVLTEERHFGGSLADLRAARAATDLPILRKDFILDPWQVAESRALGADAILLIAAILAPAELRDLATRAADLGMACLVETHTEAEVDTALAAGAPVIGINNRNLHTFETSLAVTERLAPRIRGAGERIVVSESGIFTAADVARVAAVGVDAVLVGEAIVRAADVGAKVRELASVARPGTG